MTATAPPRVICSGRATRVNAARDTATNPAVLNAFALAIIGAEEPPAYPGVKGHEPRVAQARADAAGIHRAMAELRKVKSRYDPDGLFFVHHGVGSEAWSADGFTRLDS